MGCRNRSGPLSLVVDGRSIGTEVDSGNSTRPLTPTRFAEEEQLAWMHGMSGGGMSWMMATGPSSETIPEP